MTAEVVAHGIAVGDGSVGFAPTRGRDTRARAKAMVTHGAGKIGAGPLRTASTAVVDTGRIIAADFAGAWFVRETPPPLAAVATADVRSNVPDRHPVLTAVAVGWKWLIAVPVSTITYPVLWALQRPITGIPFVIAVVATIGIIRS